ncbi:MARVEL domain-containing protein 3-like isoform X1 [Centrocercus urophasianus]|uniref:MARVEL domain-containing protein 3-like isoform X1 n=1 Tax=Centrocercus urophasianus TaxID=9002 RepID=UPI001C64E288|nr:MARVEL domain-containing protein 3-like isoform X1 [Centrocercus urophasianus]
MAQLLPRARGRLPAAGGAAVCGGRTRAGRKPELRAALRKLFLKERVHVRDKMAHAGRRYRDKQGGYHENRGSDGYEEDRKTRKPSPYNGRPAKDTRGGQHSRASTICSEPYSKASAASQECFDSPPQYYPTKETLSMKCSKVCTTRGILKFVEITVNLLVLICVGAAQASVAGFTSVGGLGVGSFNLNSAYSPFEGTELQEVRELDMQITQMRAPCIYGGVTFSLAAAALTLVFLVVGAKPIHRLKMGLLGGECAFSLLAGVCYVIAVGLYLHFVTQVNATEACKRRERLYARRGYTSMNCVVQGGDAAVGLFGVVAACLYFASFVVCILAIRTVRAFQSHMATAQHSPKSSVWDRSVRNDRPTHRTSGSSQNSQALATLV